jgi:hypothetical protein
MTVEQFESSLQAFGQQLNNLDAHLLTIGAELIAQIKALAPEDTGALKRSLQAVVDNNTLKIEMLYYGMFQNYGVSGTEDALGLKVPASIEPRPLSGDEYRFQNRQFGIPAQTFFNLEQLETQVAQRLDQLLQQDLNNIN